MVVGIGRALERDAGEARQAARKRRRKQCVTLDDAGVAVRSLFARAAAIDQRDREPALDQMQRGRDADDAGAENDRISARHVSILISLCGLYMAGAQRNQYQGWAA